MRDVAGKATDRYRKAISKRDKSCVQSLVNVVVVVTLGESSGGKG